MPCGASSKNPALNSCAGTEENLAASHHEAVAGNALAKLDDLRRLSNGNRCALKGRSWKGEPPEANRLAGMALPSTRS